MRKKYLLWGYAIIAFFIIVILCSITFTTFMGMKGARAIYDNAAKVAHDTGLTIPDFQIKEHKPGEYQEGYLFRDTLVVYFYKGIPESVFDSFRDRAEAIENAKDSTKSVEIDSLNYYYQDFYVGGFSCYIGVHINKESQYGEIIYGNWKAAKE